MAGFTYGSTTGATYGGSTGALWSPGSDHWLLDGVPIASHVSEIRDWQTLQLTWRVSAATLDTHLKPLKATAGKFETVSLADGAFSTLDRAPTGGIYTLTPPPARDPPRTERDYVIGQYDQRPLDQSIASHEVSVTFVATDARDPDGTAVDETRASDEWGFQFRAAQIATTRVQADVTEGTETSAPIVELTLVLDASQTKTLEESVTHLEAVTVREVPDGPNTVDDDAPNDENSVVITTPDSHDPISDGEYAVLDWQTEWLSSRGYRVNLTLSPTDLARTGWGWGQWGQFQWGNL